MTRCQYATQGVTPVTTLDARKQLVSDLWLDQPDAHDEIERRVVEGAMSVAEAAKLHHFTDEGYLTFTLGLDENFSQAFEADLKSIWEERPPDLAIAKAGERVSFRDFDSAHGDFGYRIPDLHSHSATALALYLHPEILRMVELIYGQQAIAIQSLYFRFGSEQALHRDPMFVATEPPSHLLASWIALEEITPECGPLLYAPGSHRMPWFEFEEDSVAMAKKSVEAQRGWAEYRDRMIEELNLKPKSFTCKRGDVFIWHAGLLHGGAPVEDQSSTRKSFVVHYSTASNYKSRSATMKTKVSEGGKEVWRPVRGTTDHVLVNGGCVGLDNPLRYINTEPEPEALPTPVRAREATTLPGRRRILGRFRRTSSG